MSGSQNGSPGFPLWVPNKANRYSIDIEAGFEQARVEPKPQQHGVLNTQYGQGSRGNNGDYEDNSVLSNRFTPSYTQIQHQTAPTSRESSSGRISSKGGLDNTRVVSNNPRMSDPIVRAQQPPPVRFEGFKKTPHNIELSAEEQRMVSPVAGNPLQLTPSPFDKEDFHYQDFPDDKLAGLPQGLVTIQDGTLKKVLQVMTKHKLQPSGMLLTQGPSESDRSQMQVSKVALTSFHIAIYRMELIAYERRWGAADLDIKIRIMNSVWFMRVWRKNLPGYPDNLDWVQVTRRLRCSKAVEEALTKRRENPNTHKSLPPQPQSARPKSSLRNEYRYDEGSSANPIRVDEGMDPLVDNGNLSFREFVDTLCIPGGISRKEVEAVARQVW